MKSWKIQLQLFIVRADLGIKNAVLQLLAAILYRKPKKVERLLIFRTGSLGDNICAIPSISAIRARYPNAAITVLANAGTSNLVSMENVLDPSLYNNMIDYLGMGKKQLYGLLKQSHFDLVIQLPQREARFTNLLRDLLFFRLVAPSGWGWQLSTFRRFRQTQEKYIAFKNETDTLLDLISRNGIPVTRHEYRLRFTVSDQEKVDHLFKESNLDKKPVVAVVIGAKRPQNRWPVGYFLKAIQPFHDRYNFVVIGGPEDAVAASLLEPIAMSFCGKLTPMQSALALQRCILTISNDTGPMHLSYAVNTPVIAIFSSRDFPGRWFPPSDGRNRVFRTPDVHCSLCLSENCGNNICMQAISPQEVSSAMNEMLTKIDQQNLVLSA